MVCSTCSVAFQHTEAKPTATVRDTYEHTDRGGTAHSGAQLQGEPWCVTGDNAARKAGRGSSVYTAS